MNQNIFRSICKKFYRKKFVIKNKLSISYRRGKSMHYPESPKVTTSWPNKKTKGSICRVAKMLAKKEFYNVCKFAVTLLKQWQLKTIWPWLRALIQVRGSHFPTPTTTREGVKKYLVCLVEILGADAYFNFLLPRAIS